MFFCNLPDAFDPEAELKPKRVNQIPSTPQKSRGVLIVPDSINDFVKLRVAS